VGNIALWRTVFSQGGGLPATGLALMVFCALMTALSFFAWRRTMKLVAALALLATALSVHSLLFLNDTVQAPLLANQIPAMLHSPREFLSLRFAVVLVCVALVPLLVISRLYLQRTRAIGQFTRIGLIWVGAIALFFLGLGMYGMGLRADAQKYSQLTPLVSPLNWVHAPRKQSTP
jgi:glucan phosphoethanolaminetransferase (alkaline phosphatase superfamily)